LGGECVDNQNRGAEVFSVLLMKAENDGLISGIKICWDAPSVSHLLFIVRMGLGSILELYEQCSGQMINKSKSAILFSANAKESEKGQVKEILEVEKETMNGRYLGLPVHVGGGGGGEK